MILKMVLDFIWFSRYMEKILNHYAAIIQNIHEKIAYILWKNTFKSKQWKGTEHNEFLTQRNVENKIWCTEKNITYSMWLLLVNLKR